MWKYRSSDAIDAICANLAINAQLAQIALLYLIFCANLTLYVKLAQKG